jgi:hypothetical protein
MLVIKREPLGVRDRGWKTVPGSWYLVQALGARHQALNSLGVGKRDLKGSDDKNQCNIDM